MQRIAIVKKNTDFTEGKGSMVFHKAFTTFKIADDYIMLQSGIFGSPQGFSSKFGNVYHYNGYSLEMVPLEDSILSIKEKKKLEEELEQITARQKEIENLLQ